MTPTRHRAFLDVRTALDTLPPGMLNRDEEHVLRDTAEGLLLVREGEATEHEDLLESASRTLSVLFGSERMSAGQSESLWEMLAACGPDRLSPIYVRRHTPMTVG